ncbi:hypothetical protein [Lactiplantibacillus plantarum]|uniref:hypothetical protein n=1 Tax=Lactiplantibacillus plantarum TaxID=1590 RepID=UPI0021CB316E|nr:hypothetical protein [Lactiplantibacillus plantarum]
MYYTIQAKVPGAVAKTKPELPDNPAWQYKRNADKQIVSIADDGGNPIMTLKYRKNGAIWYMTYFNGSLATRRDVYDAAGFLSVTQYLDRMNNSQVTLENFYRPDHSLAMVKQYGSNHELSIQLVNKEEAITNVFHSEAQLLNWWLASSYNNKTVCWLWELTPHCSTNAYKQRMIISISYQSSLLMIWIINMSKILSTERVSCRA